MRSTSQVSCNSNRSVSNCRHQLLRLAFIASLLRRRVHAVATSQNSPVAQQSKLVAGFALDDGTHADGHADVVCCLPSCGQREEQARSGLHNSPLHCHWPLALRGEAETAVFRVLRHVRGSQATSIWVAIFVVCITQICKQRIEH